MKKLTKILSIILVVMFIFVGCTTPGIIKPTEPTTEITTEVEAPTETVISEEVEEIAQDTKEQINNGESIETEEPIEANEKTEEFGLEEDGVVELENIAWDGATPADKAKAKKLLGTYQGITYYSQADSRWANVMYSSHKDRSQTIKTSGCGPTSAAMIISSSKGIILPTATAKISVDNGYRTASNGTAWSYWSFIADVFDFKTYTDTSNFNTLLSYIRQDKNNDGVADYFAVASCGPGLFTTSGHYIAIMGDTKNVLRVHDPYYYVGKFNTSSRRAANVRIDGNIAYVTEKNAYKYGNFKHFWIFSNDYVKPAPKPKTRYVSTKSKAKVYSGTTKDKKIIKTLVNGKKVKVYKTKNGYSKIGKGRWIKSKFLVKKSQLITYKTVVGKTYTLPNRTNLYSKGTLKGTEYTYKAGAKVKILKHYNTKVDKVYVIKTGRKAYVKVNKMKLK